MHCFIGLHVLEPLAQQIINTDQEWSRLGYPPADFHKHTYPHITIVPPFDTADIEQLTADLLALTAKFPQFDADYARIDVFNHHIVHIAVDSNGLVDLRAQLYELGKGKFHYQDEHPVYHPHTTVGYTHDPLTDPVFSKLKPELESRLQLPQHQEVTHIQLYGRHRPGENYRTVAELKLAAS